MSDSDQHSELLREALEILHNLASDSEDGPLGRAAVESEMAARYAALDRLVEQLETYREFYAAWWEVEKGVIDFNLHTEAVTRLSEAHAAVIQQDSNPASNPDCLQGEADCRCRWYGSDAHVPASSPQGNDLWAAWSRCPICEGVDQPGLIHQPSAPYCSQAQNQDRDPASKPFTFQRVEHLEGQGPDLASNQDCDPTSEPEKVQPWNRPDWPERSGL